MHATAFLLLSLFAPAVLAAQQGPAPGARRSPARRNATVGVAVLTQDGTDIALSWPTWHQASCPSSAGSTDAKKCGGGSEANADLSLAAHNDTAWAPAQRDDNFWNHLDSDWTSVGYRLTEAPDSYAIIERVPGQPIISWDVMPGVDFGLEADGASIFAAMDFPDPLKAVPGTNASAGPWAPLPLASLNLQWTNDCGDQTYDFGVTAYFADGTNSTAAGQDQVSLSVPPTVVSATLTIAQFAGYAQKFYFDAAQEWIQVRYGPGKYLPSVSAQYAVFWGFCPGNACVDC